jgi:hypothetical protein
VAAHVIAAIGFALVSVGGLLFGALYAMHEHLAALGVGLGWFAAATVIAVSLWRTLPARGTSGEPKRSNALIVVPLATASVLAFDRSPWFVFYLAMLGGGLISAMSVLVWRSLITRIRHSAV